MQVNHNKPAINCGSSILWSPSIVSISSMAWTEYCNGRGDWGTQGNKHMWMSYCVLMAAQEVGLNRHLIFLVLVNVLFSSHCSKEIICCFKTMNIQFEKEILNKR